MNTPDLAALVVSLPEEDDIVQLLHSVQRGAARLRPQAAKIMELYQPLLDAYAEQGRKLEAALKPKRDDMIERSEEDWERFEEATMLLYGLKAGDVLTEERLADLLFADDCRRNDDESATDAYHRGREEGLRERGGDELLRLTKRAEELLAEKMAERAIKIMVERDLSTAQATIASQAETIEGLKAALEDVKNPIRVLQRRADAEGAQLSGAAYSIANDLGFVQRIAKDALAATQGEG